MARRWLITGGTGFLGSHIVCELAKNEKVFLLTRGDNALQDAMSIQLDLTDIKALEALYYKIKPTNLLHLAAIGDLASCKAEPAYSYAVNAASTELLGQLSAENNCHMIYTSTDMVFDGENAPYHEESFCNPINEYGVQKLTAERMLTNISPQHLILRLPLMFGLSRLRKQGGSYELLEKLAAGQAVNLFTDEYRTPIWVNDAAKAIIELARQDVQGILHLPGQERLSRYELGLKTASAAGLDTALIIPQSQKDTSIGQDRPRDVSLRSKKKLFSDLTFTPLEKAMKQIAKSFNDSRRQ
jgi:dTDP-4-dehydrorhamnose reductase